MMVCLDSLLHCSDDTISDLRLLILTNKLIMTVGTISDLRYPVLTNSDNDSQFIHLIPYILCELLLLIDKLIMTVDVISDLRYPV